MYLALMEIDSPGHDELRREPVLTGR